MITTRFTLEIELGNDGMRTSQHVAEALYEIAQRVYPRHEEEGKIRDVNGNTVGGWSFER